MKKDRETNIELLRILAILIIISNHFSTYSGIIASSLNLGFNRLLLESIHIGGKLGVIIFIVIMGYFCIGKDNPFSLKKFVQLFIQVLFYSFGSYIILVFIGIVPFSVKETIRSIFPITFGQYWFFSCYIILYIFSKYINKLLNSLTKDEYITLILVGIGIFSILSILSTHNYYGNELVLFIIFYSIGGYLKKYQHNFFNNKKINILLAIANIIIIIISIVTMDILGQKIPVFSEKSTYFLQMHSPFMILLGINIFNIFNCMKIKNSSIINYISSCVFGIYLIHDNLFLHNIIWTNILHVSNYANSKFLIVYLTFCTIIVFITCLIIEIVRKETIEKVYKKHFASKIEKLEKIINNKYNKILNRTID